MRRATTAFVVLALTSLVWANQASAFGWRGAWRAARHQVCRCNSAVSATVDKKTSSPAAKPVAVSAAKSTGQPDPTAVRDQSAALVRILDVMQDIVDLENERLDRELAYHQWLEETDD